MLFAGGGANCGSLAERGTLSLSRIIGVIVVMCFRPGGVATVLDTLIIVC